MIPLALLAAAVLAWWARDLLALWWRERGTRRWVGTKSI